jgi:hypothetical protein
MNFMALIYVRLLARLSYAFLLQSSMLKQLFLRQVCNLSLQLIKECLFLVQEEHTSL